MAVTTNVAPKIGDPPPLLTATTLLQAPSGAKLNAETLKGKVVVLEFWATWCGPCVLAIPHLNELADKFKDQPVQFVAITAEDEATVKTFLAKKPIRSWVALDSDKAMNKAFDVEGIPHTVVIGKDGLIAAITYPTTVTEQFIKDCLAGKPVATNAVSRSIGHAVASADGKSEAAPVFEVSVRPSASDKRMGSSRSMNSLRYRGFTVWDLLPEAFEGASPARLRTNATLPTGRFDVAVVQPRGHSVAEAHELLWQALQSAFALTVAKTTNEVDVLVLRPGQTNGPGLTPTASVKGSGNNVRSGKIEAVNAPLDWLAWTLENKLNIPVIDETETKARYDIKLAWDEKTGDPDANAFYPVVPDPENLIKAVHEQLGLELVPAKRPIVEFVVGKLAKPATVQK